MNNTLFLMGCADNPAQGAMTTQDVGGGLLRRNVDLAGVLPILPFVTEDKTLAAHCEWFLVGQEPLRLAPNTRRNLFNLVGDADSSKNMLYSIQALERHIQPIRSFNRPHNVFRTSRENLPATLAGIPGCMVPQVKSEQPTSMAQLVAACEAFGHWPMIVRARGYHGGEHMVLLQTLADLDSISGLPWVLGDIHLIEYVDYQNPEGLYQKVRVVMVDGFPVVRHAITSDKWVIHSGSRTDLMDGDKRLCQQEQDFLEHFSSAGLERYREVFQRIQQRIGLDVFGIDFALVNEQIVLFEANACMNFLNQDYGADNRYLYLQSRVKQLRRSIKKMLMQA